MAKQYTLKKSLGQHFLHDEAVCKRIVEVLTTEPYKNLLEVGPGAGALTKYLIKIPNINFKAVELDQEKIDFLLKTYPKLQGKTLHESMLDMQAPFDDQFAVIGNFPYNISTQILFKILDWKHLVTCVVGMFQKEVALRLAAKPGSKVYGVSSVLIQAWYKVEYLFDVLPTSFNPPPKVMSGVIKLTPKSINTGNEIDTSNTTPNFKSEKHFRLLVKTAFNQRRKTLRNATKTLFDENVLKEDIFNKRAEQLSINDFAVLSYRMKDELYKNITPQEIPDDIL